MERASTGHRRMRETRRNYRP